MFTKAVKAGPVADQVQAIWNTIKEKNQFNHDQIYRGLILANSKSRARILLRSAVPHGDEEFDDAGKALKIAQQLGPGRWDCYTYQGSLAANTGDLEGATTALGKALELNPKDGAAHAILSRVLSRQNKLEEARDEYRLALLYDSLLSAEDKATVVREIAEINEKLPAK